MLFTGGMTDVLQLEMYSIYGCTFVTVAKWNTLSFGWASVSKAYSFTKWLGKEVHTNPHMI